MLTEIFFFGVLGLLIILLGVALYFNWQGTRPISDEVWDKAYNKAWDESLKKLSGK
jgi:hypothetical protein